MTSTSSGFTGFQVAGFKILFIGVRRTGYFEERLEGHEKANWQHISIFLKAVFEKKISTLICPVNKKLLKLGKYQMRTSFSNHLTIRFWVNVDISYCKIIRKTATHGATLELKLKNQCWGESFLAAEIQTKWQNVPSRLLDRSFSLTHLIQTFIKFAVGKTINVTLFWSLKIIGRHHLNGLWSNLQE